MYRGFVFAQDAIADFVRSLEGVSKVALYSYSRDLSRVAPLTPDRSQVLRGVRNTVAGDDAALYNSLLLTVKDAAPSDRTQGDRGLLQRPRQCQPGAPGGRSRAGAVHRNDHLHDQHAGRRESEPVSTAVFERMSKATGGKAYFSKDWKDEKQAFASIRDDLAHLYALSYYPQPNANRGWRAIYGEAGGQESAEVPHPDSSWIPPPPDRAGEPVNGGVSFGGNHRK